MKKALSLLCFALISLVSMQANAELWLIGDLSSHGWSYSQGDKFTAVDANNYTLDVNVTSAGDKYFSMTTKLGSSWDDIVSSRFGGDGITVPLNTETTLTAGTDKSPKVSITSAGTYTITFNTSTKKVKISLKQEGEKFNGTIYVTKDSKGYVYAWDAAGNYGEWPGTAISSLSTATVNGTEYYKFTYSHNSTGPGLIFNEGQGLAQTGDLVPEDGRIYKYVGGTDTATTVTTVTPDLYLFGPAAKGWDPTKGDKMTYDEAKNTYSIAITPDDATSFSFTTKLATTANDWNAIAAYRYGADTDGNDFVFSDTYLDKPLTLIKTDASGHAFAVPAGSYTITVSLDSMKVTISGAITPEPVDTAKVYILGNVVGEWDPTVGQQMTTTDGTVYTAKLNAIDAGDGNSYFSFTTKLGTWEQIATSRFGAVSEGNFVVTPELIGKNISLVQGGQTIQIPAGEYDLTLNLDSMKLVIAGEIVVPVDTADVYVLGEVNGNTWAANKGAKMTFADGKYTLKVTTEGENDGYSYFSFTTELAEGNEQADWEVIADKRFGAVSEGDFLVTKDLIGKSLSLEKGGDSFKIPAGEFDLTLDLDSMKLVIDGEIVEKVDTAKVYILGNVVGDWNPAVGQQMATTDGKVYTAKLNAVDAGDGYSYFSFTTKLDSIWDNIADARFGAVSEGNFLVTPELIGKNISLVKGGESLKIPAGEYDLTLNLDSMKLVIEGEIVVPVDTAKVYILGNVVGDWNPAVGQQMATTDGKVYTAKLNAVDAGEGYSYFSFTTKLDSIWDNIADARFGAVSEGDFLVTPELIGKNISLVKGGESLKIPAGEYDLTLNLDSMTLVIEGEIVVPVDTAKVYILGNVVGDWNPAVGQQMATTDGKVYTAKLNAVDAGEGYSYFSFTTKLDSIWDNIADARFGAVSEGNFLVTPELIGKNISLVKGGESLKIPAGEYDLTLNLDSMTLVIEGEIVVPVDTAKVYILGNVVGNWNPAVGQQMATTDGKVYTAKLNAVDAGEGYSYFSFTTKLDSIWDNIADARFGAVSEGDFLVTPELIGEELSLEKGGDSFKIPTGNYNLTLDLEKMKLVIVEADDILLGDANGDGEVNSLDVTTIVNWILGNEVNKFVFDNADINGDEDINSADVTAVVNIILNN